MSSYRQNSRQQGGVKNTNIGAGVSVTGGNFTSFTPQEDAVISVLTTESGDDCIALYNPADIHIAGVPVYLPSRAANITVDSGRINAYE